MTSCDSSSTFSPLKLIVLAARYGIYRLSPTTTVSERWWSAEFVSITRSSNELTVVCAEGLVGEYEQCEPGWRCLKVDGCFPFDTVGVIASISRPLAEVDVSLFVVSTFDTDYVLIKNSQLSAAIACLTQVGHEVAYESQ